MGSPPVHTLALLGKMLAIAASGKYEGKIFRKIMCRFHENIYYKMVPKTFNLFQFIYLKSHYCLKELRTIRTLVNSDLIRTSAVDNSDLGQFRPWSIRTSTTGQSDPIKTRSELTNAFFENRVRIDFRSELTKVQTKQRSELTKKFKDIL